MCFFFCLGLYGVQILAMGAILQTAVGIDLIPAALISSVITLAYTWSGGMLAVTMTDAVQYVIIIIGVSCAGISPSTISAASTHDGDPERHAPL